MSNNEKLETLRKEEGYASVIEMLEKATYDSVCPGICTHCDYTTEVEPDQSEGYCEMCNTNTVKSALILAGLI